MRPHGSTNAVISFVPFSGAMTGEATSNHRVPVLICLLDRSRGGLEAEEERRAGDGCFLLLDIGKYFHKQSGDQGIGAGLSCPQNVHSRDLNKDNFHYS